MHYMQRLCNDLSITSLYLFAVLKQLFESSALKHLNIFYCDLTNAVFSMFIFCDLLKQV
jgi:hypothetical protein